jgi:hypothetical protein
MSYASRHFVHWESLLLEVLQIVIGEIVREIECSALRADPYLFQ